MRASSAERYEGFFLESRMTEGLLAYLFPPVPPQIEGGVLGAK